MYTDIINERKKIDKMCGEFFLAHGYFNYPEEPLIPRSDTTISFTNSAIVPFKSFIKSEKIPQMLFFTRQKCIRLRETANIPSPNYLMERMSCFHMYGSFANISKLNRIIDDTVYLLNEVLKTDKKRLVFNVCSEDKIFYNHLLELEYSNNV